MAADEALATLLADAERAQLQLLGAIPDRPERVAQLKDAVLFLLDVLAQVETRAEQREALAALRRVFSPCVAYLYDARAFLDDSAAASVPGSGSGLLMSPRQGVKRGNIVLKALLGAITALSTRSEFPEEIVRGLVDMVRELCAQSIHSADVVMLFDFLRLGKPPTRRWLLQAQRYLVELPPTPQAIFAMQGEHAGIIAPSHVGLLTKKGYTCSFGVRLDPGAPPQMALYSFRGQSGHGVSALLDGNTLVVRSHIGLGAVQQVEVPFAEWRVQMERTWVHLCVVHAKKMVFKDKVTVFADGKSIYTGNLAYPDTLNAAGGQNSVGVMPAAPGIQGKLWSPTLFGLPLSEAEVQKLHWLTHWKNDLSSVAAENVGLADKSKFMFSYDARNCDLDRRICHDVSGNECHGWLEPGTRTYVTQNFVQALDSIGGCACFLLLLLDQVPEMADFHPKTEFGMDEIADLLAFVGSALQSSIECRAHFIRLHGAKVIEFVLQSISPSYLSPDLLDSVVRIIDALISCVENDHQVLNDLIHRLLFFNPNWFLSPFDTQVKLIDEVLPRYLQLLQDHKIRYLHFNHQSSSEPADLFAQNPSLLNDFERPREVDVDFFCNLIVQVYLARESADGECVTTAHMDEYQLKHLRILIIQNLIGRMLSPSPGSSDTSMTQWEQLIAHICRRCGGEAIGSDECAEVEEILSYLTQVLNSDISRTGSFSAPLTRQQLTSAICSVSKGTLRVIWRPMIVSLDSVRLAALRFFESYTSEKVLLRRRDFLMLCSALQAHLLTPLTVDLLLNIVIGRRTADSVANGKSASLQYSTRTSTMARLEFVPTVLLGLLHNAELIDQMQILMEIKTQILSPAVSDIVREAIRAWPPWMSRLQAIALRAGERHEQIINSSAVASASVTESEVSAEALNDVCNALSDEDTPISIKLDALQTIAQSGDQRGCDFALGVLQSNLKSGLVMRAVVNLVSEKFPDRAALVVAKLASQLIVDVVVYSIINVRNGWMHILELFFYYSKRPSDLCNLVAAICDRVLQRVELRQWPGGSGESVVWENLSQVAAIVSQCGTMATAIGLKLGIHEAALSSGQQMIFVRKAFDLWVCVSSHLDEIRWDDLAMHLEANADYGFEITSAEKEIFTSLAANYTQAQELMLQTAIKRIRFADFSCRDTSWGLVDAFARMITSMKLIPTTHHLKAPGSRSFSSRMTSTIRSTTGVASPPVSRGSFHGSLPYSGSGNNIAATLSSGSSETAAALDERFRAHLTALNAGFTALDKSLQADSPSAETAQLLVRIMIGLASNGLRTRDEEGESNELLKTLQIISSTDAEFFHEIPQIQELSHLWHLHWDTNYMDESFGCISPVAASASKFLNRWVTVMEQHNREFNPYLIQKHAAVQAEILGNELYSSEQLWKEILDRSTELSTARQSCNGVEEEPRLVELKQDVDKFASSIHKLLTRSSLQNASLLMNGDSANDNPVASDVSLDGNSSMRTTELNNRTSNCDDEVAGDTGPILKVSSRENAFRMRLRLKEVSPNYRIRNLSCECAGSGFLETESKGSGKFIARRLLGSLDHSGGDLDKSWRSDADSDYSDFLADAQMRAAIIRSSSNVDTQGLPLADGFSDDDIDIADDGYDEEVDDGDEDEMQDEAIEENSSTRRVDADALGSPKGLTTTLDQFIAPTEDHESSQSAVIADESSNLPVSTSSSAIPIPVLVSSVPSPPTSAASSLKSIASSPLSAYNFGASVLSAVGGMAGFVQKAAKDAKDVVEYGVDSLYTAKDAFSEEAQSIMQEVSTIMDNNVAQVSLDNLEGPADPVTSPASVSIPEKVAFAAHGDLKNSLRDTSAPSTHLPPTPPVRLNLRSRREIQFRVKLIRHLHVVEGRLLLSDSLFGFIADRVVDEHDAVIVERKGSVPIDKPWRFLFKNRRWRIDDISGLYRRRYLLKPTALEVFIQSTRKNYFFNFTGDEVTAFHEALMNRRPLLLKRDPTVRRLRHPSSIFRNSNMTSRWVNHEVSTFEYLMWLNTIAGRTYNDLTQYPVFPWVIADYESPTLDLSRRSTYRDLSKPMGALEPSRLKFFLDRYQAFDDPDIPKFMYGTHYSNIGAVLYYLIRLEPFTSFALAVQGGKYDHADRLFHCVAETWRNCLTDFTDLKELTPEWFYLPEFLMNRNRLDLGIKQNGVPIGNVVLPPWAKSPEDFVLKNLLVLESDYVSANIHQWIDLVFGAKQRGPAAEAASNIFFYLTYEGMVDIDSITDPVLKSSMRAQIAHFGQTPTQVLRDPHPSRQVQAQDLVPDMLFGPEPEAYLGHAPEILRTAVDMTQLVVPHEAPVVHIAMIPGTSTILCLDSNGMLSTHRYGAKSTKVHHHHQQRDLSQHQHNHLTLNDISASATRATASVFKTTSTPVTSPTNSGQASVDRTHLPVSDFLELQDRKSHRALGEKRLLEGSADSLCLSHRVAFLSSGSVLCSVGHHDFSARFHSAADGSLLYRLLQHSAVVTCLGTNRLGSLLTLGSADGTLSVWKVAHSNSTILDTIRLFRRGARGGVPGTSSKASSLPSSPVSSSKPVLGNDYAADQVLLGHRARINCVSISEELNVCVSGSAANECLAHSLEDGAILRQFDVGTGTLAPGVTAVALSSVGHVIAHSMGSGMPVLLSFHLNGTLLAKLEVPGGHPITFLDICSRSSRVVTNDGNVATVMSALTLRDHQVLLRASDISKSNGLGKDSQKDRITAQALAPDEERVIFGVGVGRIVCVSLPLPSPIDDGT